MNKTKTKKIVILIFAAVLLIAGYLFYSRPMTIKQRYPMLEPDKCTKLTGYYKVDEQTEFTEFTVEKDSKEFQALWELLYEQGYRRSLKDILPRGTRTHPTQEGEFQWEVIFHFDNVVLDDGSVGSGGMFHIQSWYGELDIYFDGETLACYTADQKAWEKEVLGAIG